MGVSVCVCLHVIVHGVVRKELYSCYCSIILRYEGFQMILRGMSV